MTAVQEVFDVAIVGGGLVGTSLALALSGTALKVVVLEAAPAVTDSPPGFDDRGFALSIATQRILSGLGVWQELAERATAVTTIHISERGRFGVTRLEAGDFSVDALASVVLARDVGAVLRARLDAAANVTLYCPARVVDVRNDAGNVRLTAAHGAVERPLHARLVVVADGVDSMARRQLGVDVRERDYRQTAIVGNVRMSRPSDGVAYERFAADGPTALLPQREGRFGLVHVLPTDAARVAMEQPDEQFLAAVQARFGRRAGDFAAIGRRSAYPLRLCVANQVAGHRFVIAGNAAHAVHPNGAQGFNLGIRDVAVLAELLCAAGRDGTDPGSDALTAAYAQRCRGDHARTVWMTDALPTLFYNDWIPHRLLRGLGMLAIEFVPPLKREVFRLGSGLRGAPSQLLRGIA